MAASRPSSGQTKTARSVGRSTNYNSDGNMGTNTGTASSETAFVSFLILLTMLFFIILPFELYLYIIVKDAVAMCYKVK